VTGSDELRLAAPSDQPRTLLHITEPGAADLWLEGTLTLCGIPMCGCHWETFDRQPGDRLCPVCVDALGRGALALLTLLEGAA
jgi:hypothetical protein